MVVNTCGLGRKNYEFEIILGYKRSPCFEKVRAVDVAQQKNPTLHV